MIRPITLICWVLMLGAGLYLYRAKHEVELIDRRIVQIVKDTEAVRADTRRMYDKWTELSEPMQLQKYSDQYLGLKPVVPTQFVRLSDLGNRLPAARPPVAVDPVIIDPVAATQTEAVNPVIDAELEELPVPPVPPERPAAIIAAVTVTKPADINAGSAEVVDDAVPSRRSVPRETRVPNEPRIVDDARREAVKPPPVRTPEPRITDERAVPRRDPVRGVEPRGEPRPQPQVVDDARLEAVRPPVRARAEPRYGEETRPETIPERPKPVVRKALEPRVVDDARPAPPKPAVPKQVAIARPPEVKRGEPKVADARPLASQPAPHLAPQPASHLAEPRAEPRPRQAEPAAPRQYQPPAPSAPSGSLLGMARGGGSSVPAPMPVSANWSNR